MDVSPAGVYERMVVQRKGGSYCFGQNGLLLGMLRGLGYRRVFLIVCSAVTLYCWIVQ